MKPARILSLAQLIALPLRPPQLLQLAADVGCSHVGLRLLPASPGGAHHPLHTDAALMRDTLAAMAETGVRVLDLELIRINPGLRVADCHAFMAAGAQLGARHILVAGDDTDEARTIDRFAALCEAARGHGLTCELEFMPWTAVRDLPSAQRIVTAAAQPNGGVLVDALHWSRSGGTLAQVAALPRAMLRYAQICDGAVPGPTTLEGMIFDARCERGLPGEGGIALVDLFRQLPADLPVSIEVPSDSRAPVLGYTEWARRALAATHAVLSATQARHPPT